MSLGLQFRMRLLQLLEVGGNFCMSYSLCIHVVMGSLGFYSPPHFRADPEYQLPGTPASPDEVGGRVEEGVCLSHKGDLGGLPRKRKNCNKMVTSGVSLECLSQHFLCQPNFFNI